LALVLALASICASGQTRSGQDYRRLDPPRSVSAAQGRIEVLEFFYYGCPVCYEAQPPLARWLRGVKDVSLQRVPAVGYESPNFEAFAKLYYALEALGEIERLHWPIYDNFHFDGVQLNDPSVMADWVARNGVDRAKFLDAYGSAGVRAKVADARGMMKSYEVTGVPTLVVDGKYLTSARLAGGTEQMIRVLDRLTRQARSERPR
jgi:thiol:disulfide interchange protein DsbA